MTTPEINYSGRLPFLNYRDNIVEWTQCDAITHYFSALGNAENKKVRVLHIGDSHVQTDYYTGILRNQLQEIFGYGGRGFVFPYKSAGTHATYDYATHSWGVWDFSRNIQREPKFDLGISGATIHTADTNAGFSIIFRSKYNSIRPDFTKLRIFCKTDSSSFGLQMKTGADATPILIPVFSKADMGYVDVELPFASDSLLFSLYRTDTLQTRFECSGVLIESNSDNGVLYSSVGINGAGYKSILKETLFEKQLETYSPHLVIIDVGANDFYPFSFRENELEANLSKIIAIIRKAAPTCSILITNSHDLWKRRMNIPACKQFSALTRKVAQAEHCAFYDYYNVSGGPFALAQWRRAGLAQPDRVHLTYKGYALKAELMANAMLTSYREYVERSPDELVVSKFFADTTDFEETIPDSVLVTVPVAKPEAIVSATSNRSQVVSHTVRKGESISDIALRYQISYNDVKVWNNLKKNRLFAGQKLRVAPPVLIEPVQKTAKTNPLSADTRKSPEYHSVKKGESLTLVARKYGTTTERLKKINRLKKGTIHPGMRLIIQ